MKKPNIAKLIKDIKKSVKEEKGVKPHDCGPMRIDIDYEKGPKVRDMRQEAKDIGAYGANEFFSGDAA